MSAEASPPPSSVVEEQSAATDGDMRPGIEIEGKEADHQLQSAADAAGITLNNVVLRSGIRSVGFSRTAAYRMTALHVAAATGEAERLFNAYAQNGGFSAHTCNYQDAAGRTPLHFAAATGNRTSVEALLEHGGNSNAQDADGKNVGMWAAFYGHHKVLALLLAAGLELGHRDLAGRSILHWAALANSPKALDFLCKQCTMRHLDINPADLEQLTPLHWVCHLGFNKHVAILLKAKADVCCLDVEQRNPLHWTASNQDASVTKPTVRSLLLALRLTKHLKCIVESTATHAVAPAGAESPLCVAALLKTSINVNKVDSDGRSLLHLLAYRNDAETIAALKLAKVDPNVIDAAQQTALMLAVENNHLAAARELLAAGANPVLGDAEGRIPLSVAVIQGYEELAALILSQMQQENLLLADSRGETFQLHVGLNVHGSLTLTLLNGRHRVQENAASTTIQRFVRGFLVRRQMDRGRASDQESAELQRIKAELSRARAQAAAAERARASEAKQRQELEEETERLRLQQQKLEQRQLRRPGRRRSSRNADKSSSGTRSSEHEKVPTRNPQASAAPLANDESTHETVLQNGESQSQIEPAGGIDSQSATIPATSCRSSRQSTGNTGHSSSKSRHSTSEVTRLSSNAPRASGGTAPPRVSWALEKEEDKQPAQGRSKTTNALTEMDCEGAVSSGQHDDTDEDACSGSDSEDGALLVLNASVQRARIVKSEQQRVAQVRAKVQAAIRIQRFWRRHRGRTWRGRPVCRALPPSSQLQGQGSRRGRRSQGVQRGNGRTLGSQRRRSFHKTAASSRGAALGHVRPQLRSCASTFPAENSYGPEEQRRRLLAVLTIQLWFRKQLARRHAQRQRSLSAQIRDMSLVRKHQKCRVKAVYGARTERAKPFLPSRPRSLHSHRLMPTPAPLDVSFFSAARSYSQRTPRRGRHPVQGDHPVFRSNNHSRSSTSRQVHLPLAQAAQVWRGLVIFSTAESQALQLAARWADAKLKARLDELGVQWLSVEDLPQLPNELSPLLSRVRWVVQGPFNNTVVIAVESSNPLHERALQPQGDRALLRAMRAVTVDCAPGTAPKIAAFYAHFFAAKTRLYNEGSVAGCSVALGADPHEQELVFVERSEPLQAYDGHHFALYLNSRVAFAAAFSRLQAAGLVWVNPRFQDCVTTLAAAEAEGQFRILNLVDPAEPSHILFTLEHEVRGPQHKDCPLQLPAPESTEP
ncbi:uncharacterized protein MONBRDRAFT_7731 [Monosiga brevicollis MX1]|uniref:Uncharacterized protein n=1 Tax=Monosiga brevicollis TaxID=81824 RepID=A9UY50_MONBE|nr:uncharacterized protein MONBRDRAFT_7731 [Monosiga brevicollis MX1]EDQ89799.1 predicted protein [Monosiga brevicollis MX1]|eukprot:XP_001745221.1 hypothetical protein [Monosiga brevicollis MX1]